jgi:hypothetical protein
LWRGFFFCPSPVDSGDLCEVAVASW